MNGKTGVPGGKPTSQMQCKPYVYDINLDEGFTATKAQENNKRERDAHIHSHMHIYVLMQYYGKAMPTVNASEGVGGKAEEKKSTA